MKLPPKKARCQLDYFVVEPLRGQHDERSFRSRLRRISRSNAWSELREETGVSSAGFVNLERRVCEDRTLGGMPGALMGGVLVEKSSASTLNGCRRRRRP